MSNWDKSVKEAVELEADGESGGTIMCMAIDEFLDNLNIFNSPWLGGKEPEISPETLTEFSDKIDALDLGKFRESVISVIAMSICKHKDSLPCWEGFQKRAHDRLVELGCDYAAEIYTF